MRSAPEKSDRFISESCRTAPPRFALTKLEREISAAAERDGDDDAIKKPGRPLDNIQVTVGDRIKTPGVNGCPHGRMVAEGAAGGKKKQKETQSPQSSPQELAS